MHIVVVSWLQRSGVNVADMLTPILNDGAPGGRRRVVSRRNPDSLLVYDYDSVLDSDDDKIDFG